MDSSLQVSLLEQWKEFVSRQVNAINSPQALNVLNGAHHNTDKPDDQDDARFTLQLLGSRDATNTRHLILAFSSMQSQSDNIDATVSFRPKK